MIGLFLKYIGIPQVHGVVNDTLKFVRGLIECEMNSGNKINNCEGICFSNFIFIFLSFYNLATDNPMVFVGENEDDEGLSKSFFFKKKIFIKYSLFFFFFLSEIISGGNFHGEYPAKVSFDISFNHNDSNYFTIFFMKKKGS